MNQEIPDGWNKVKFKELAKQKSVRIDNPGESGFEKYVGLEHLDSGELVVKRYGSTSDVTSTMKLFNKGDILFARRNTYLKRVSVAPFDGVCSGDIIVLEPILEHIIEGFLPIFMQFEPFENRIVALSAGAFSKRIKWKQLAEEEIVIPSIEEQKKISEIIWSIDENAKKNEGLMSTTEVLNKGLLNKLLTKGIGHKKLKDGESEINPNGWKSFKLSQTINIIGGGTPKTTKSSYWNGNIPWISVEDFDSDIRYLECTKKTITQEGLENSSTRMLPKDSIVISARGTVGLVGQLARPMAFNQSCYGLIGKENISNDFLYYLLLFKLDDLKHKSYGSTFKSITRKDFNLICVDLPNLAEQKQIVKVLDEFMVLISNYRNHIQKLINLKKKLTNDYLSGKLLISKEVL